MRKVEASAETGMGRKSAARPSAEQGRRGRLGTQATLKFRPEKLLAQSALGLRGAVAVGWPTCFEVAGEIGNLALTPALRLQEARR